MAAVIAQTAYEQLGEGVLTVGEAIKLEDVLHHVVAIKIREVSGGVFKESIYEE